jgi:hypothetical protein
MANTEWLYVTKYWVGFSDEWGSTMINRTPRAGQKREWALTLSNET